jgi:serine/threonine protein kinase
MSVETAQPLPPRYAEPERIGYGGMGDIYRAKDRELGRDVAVKVLAERFASDENVRARFTNEALTAARLSGHPHIVTIFDVGEWNGRPFIVMEYLPGGTLAERTRRDRVQPRQALAWLEQAAGALDAAHREAIVHRDVKPANLLFDGRDELNVVDFGIARVLDETTSGMTAAGTILGTSGYLSPEQANGEPATEASDIYALGVVAFELLTGGRPFERGSATAEAAAHIHEPVPPASSRAPWLPLDVDRVFERALAKDPGQRYSTASELVHDLYAALEAGEQETRIVSAPPPAPPYRVRSPWVVPALLGLLLLGGGALAAIALTNGDPEQRAAPEVRTITRPVTEQGETITRTFTRTVTTAAEEPPPPSPSPTPPPPSGPLSRTEAAALNNEAFALMNQGRYEEALPLLQRALPALRGYPPNEAYAEYNLGKTLLELGQCGEAIPHLNRSEQLQGPREEITRAREAAQNC